MGGGPGTDKLVENINVLVLSGGSAFGLNTASGVAGTGDFN